MHAIIPELRELLRTKLQNFDINIKIVKLEMQEKNNFLTPKDQFNKLIETNPLIEELRNKLDLDLEY